MSKKTENTEEQNVQQEESVDTAATEQNTGGSKILTAKTREDLFAQVESLKASNKDATVMAGAVGQTDEGDFLIQVTIIKLK